MAGVRARIVSPLRLIAGFLSGPRAARIVSPLCLIAGFLSGPRAARIVSPLASLQ
ncbi:hypothetical protein [Mycolicibacter virginiensis]|uniref:hypothetical protein n=1 Tax=Mycolicibacter virginiensis TaxID=1795032 RepID=UPI00178CA416|nr:MULTISPECIES: hypothetical protein [Mycobacteriaceae]ULP49276.1 hypothetical protein MJO54_09630 [Mycolicibacter virginiensis]